MSISVDASEFTRQMRELSDRLIVAAPKVVAIECAKLLETVVKFTPPNNQLQGLKAVRRDVNRAVTVPLGKIRSKSEIKAIETKDYTAFQAIMNNSKWLKGYSLSHYDDSLHKSKRNWRGRVRSSENVITLDVEQRNARITKMEARVGSAKKSWGPALELVGGKLPSWVQKANGRVDGLTIINQLSDQINPAIEIRNATPGVINSDNLATQLARAIKARVIAMQRNLARMLSDPLKYSNLIDRYK